MVPLMLAALPVTDVAAVVVTAGKRPVLRFMMLPLVVPELLLATTRK
jgi:hypothetical protein